MSHGGRNDVSKHVGGKKHIQRADATNRSQSIVSLFKGRGYGTAHHVIEAEAQWALFVAKLNLAFLTSDHATKLFSKHVPGF